MHVVAVLHQPALQQGELVGIVLENGDAHGRMIMRRRPGAKLRPLDSAYLAVCPDFSGFPDVCLLAPSLP